MPCNLPKQAKNGHLKFDLPDGLEDPKPSNEESRHLSCAHQGVM